MGLLTGMFENPPCPPWLFLVITLSLYPFISVTNRILGNIGTLGVLVLTDACAVLVASIFMGDGYVYGSSGLAFGALGASTAIATRPDCQGFINPKTVPEIPRLTEVRRLFFGRGAAYIFGANAFGVLLAGLRGDPKVWQNLDSLCLHVVAFVVAYIATSLYPKKLSADFESRWPWAFSALYLTLFSTWYLTLLVCGGG